MSKNCMGFDGYSIDEDLPVAGLSRSDFGEGARSTIRDTSVNGGTVSVYVRVSRLSYREVYEMESNLRQRSNFISIDDSGDHKTYYFNSIRGE